MSDELNELQRRLEWATVPESPVDPPEDAETAALGEGWLALGQLLEAAEPWQEPFELRKHPERTRQVGWRSVVAAAVAASLLIGVALAWKLTGGGAPGSEAKPSGAVAVNMGREGAVIVSPERTGPEPPAEDLGWDDPLDQQIASVGQEVVRVQQDWYGGDDAFGPVYRGLEQMDEDLAESSL